MRLALVLGSLIVGSLSFVVACTGGPGSADQGVSSDQYGTITGAAGGGAVTPDTSGGGRGTDEEDTAAPTNPPNSSGGNGNPGGNGAGGGGGGGELKADQFEQSCEQDTDCEPVQEGNVCTVCVCNNAAIASGDRERFNTERNSRLLRCDVSSFTNTDPSTCGTCDAKPARCEGKKCVLR